MLEYSPFPVLWGFPGGSAGKESARNAGDLGEIPGSGRSWRRDRLPTPVFLGFLVATRNAGELGLVPGLGRSPGAGYPLQYSCMENSTDRGAWRATAHGVTKSPTRLRAFHFLPPFTDGSRDTSQSHLSGFFQKFLSLLVCVSSLVHSPFPGVLTTLCVFSSLSSPPHLFRCGLFFRGACRLRM